MQQNEHREKNRLHNELKRWKSRAEREREREIFNVAE